MTAFQIRFPLDEVTTLSCRYSYKPESGIARVAADARDRGFLSREDLLDIVQWKSPRVLPKAKANTEDYVQEVSRVSFNAANEQLRIEVLTLLHGVSWPIASVILHFCAVDRYPVLDFRALWSVGVNAPKYEFDLWKRYTEYCRLLAVQAKVSMRVLDRALWQYSVENQPRR